MALQLVLGLALGVPACGDEEKPTPDEPEEDASNPKDAGRDARNSVPDTGPKDAGPPDTTLEPLAGRYLIRLDTLGTASSPNPPPLSGDIVIRSRVSTLVAAELKVEGDHLVSRERVCTQAVQQRCDMTCTGATTEVDPRTISDFLLKNDWQRTYNLEDGTLTAERAVYTLGYDGRTDDDAPTSADDDRVWDVVPGGVREGFLTKLKVTALLTISCNAYGTQKFVSTFSGKLTGSDSAPEFPEMELDLTGSAGTRLGSDNPNCDAQEASSDVETANARMVRYGDDLDEDEFWSCPTVAVFDQEIPPTPL